MSDSVYLYQSVSPSPSSPSSHSLLTFPTTSLSFHNISSVPSTTLDPSQSLLVRCAAIPLWSTMTKYYIYNFWSINLLETTKIQKFLHRWCQWCYEFKYTYSGFSSHVCGLISLSSGLFLWFLICGLVQVSFLSLAVNFSIATILLLILD